MSRPVRSASRWALCAMVGLLTACASPGASRLSSLDQVLAGVPNADMQQRWRQAEAEGRLPPLQAIPVPRQGIEQRHRSVVAEPAREPIRPVIPARTVATVLPFSRMPVESYDGPYQIVSIKPGVIVGNLVHQEHPYELHYKLPGEVQQLAIAEPVEVTLSVRDEVVDSALQRRVVLSTRTGEVPLALIAEGSNAPYRLIMDAPDLSIEQVDVDEKTGVAGLKVSYDGDSITLKPGGRGQVGRERPLAVYVLESSAMPRQRAMLQEGQPYYVNVMLYRVRKQ